jgi:hypothetical protein
LLLLLQFELLLDPRLVRDGFGFDGDVSAGAVPRLALGQRFGGGRCGGGGFGFGR